MKMIKALTGFYGTLEIEGLTGSPAGSSRVRIVEAQDVSTTCESGKLRKYRFVVETIGVPDEVPDRSKDAAESATRDANSLLTTVKDRADDEAIANSAIRAGMGAPWLGEGPIFERFFRTVVDAVQRGRRARDSEDERGL